MVNGLQLMRSTKSPDWTAAREQAMTTWMKTYVAWLQGSDIGKSTASKAKWVFWLSACRLIAC